MISSQTVIYLNLDDNVNKTVNQWVSLPLSIYLTNLHNDQGIPIRDSAWRYQQRWSKLTGLDERTIIRALHYACEDNGNFTSKRIQIYSGVLYIHDRTVRRGLNKYGYHAKLERKISWQKKTWREVTINFFKRL